MRFSPGTKVIAATGLNRDIMKRGTVKHHRTSLALVEINVDGKLLVWPAEFVFRADGKDARCEPPQQSR